MAELAGWFAGRLPEGWFEGEPEVRADDDEIWVLGRLPDVELEADADEEAHRAARLGRIKRFREETREQRIRIAREAQRRYRRRVAWGAACGDERVMFTTLGLPVMTRLRLSERQVLDTLIDGGVARSRSEALAWCVRLVENNEEEWIRRLQEALVSVKQVRAEGPQS